MTVTDILLVFDILNTLVLHGFVEGGFTPRTLSGRKCVSYIGHRWGANVAGQLVVGLKLNDAFRHVGTFLGEQVRALPEFGNTLLDVDFIVERLLRDQSQGDDLADHHAEIFNGLFLAVGSRELTEAMLLKDANEA